MVKGPRSSLSNEELERLAQEQGGYYEAVFEIDPELEERLNEPKTPPTELELKAGEKLRTLRDNR